MISSDRWIGSDDGSDGQATAIQSSIQPRFTGYLELNLEMDLDLVVSQLASPPGSLHFRRLHLTLNQQENALPVTELVESCRLTLGYLEVEWDLSTFVCYSSLHQLLIPVHRPTTVGVN